MTPLDYSVLLLYAAGMLAIGRYYATRTKTADDYLLGGRRMGAFMIGLSLFATLTSTLSYLAYPGEMIKNGPMIFAALAAYPFIMIVVGWVLIPRIMRQKGVTSGYELLETRLGVTGRLLGAGMFVALRTLWMASIFYATSNAVLRPMLGLSDSWTPWLALVMGLVTLVYTAEGGLRAVVVTDAMQSFIMFAGAIVIVAVITAQLGVGGWWPSGWPAHWQQPVFWFSTGDRVTFMGAALNMFVWMTCTAGSDQMAIQRYLATRDARTARRSFGVHLGTEVIMSVLLALVGLAVLGYFQSDPGQLASGMSVDRSADHLLTRFIVIGLPPGLTGLVIAAMLSAAMSSLSSGMNSSSAVITTDFIARFRPVPLTQAEEVRLARIVAVTIGALALLLSNVVPLLATNLLDVCIKVVNLLTAPLFVLFFLALFVRWATPTGAVAATAASVGTAVNIAFFKVFGLEFLWTAPAAFAVGAAAGMAASAMDRWPGQAVPNGEKP